MLERWSIALRAFEGRARLSERVVERPAAPSACQTYDDRRDQVGHRTARSDGPHLLTRHSTTPLLRSCSFISR